MKFHKATTVSAVLSTMMMSVTSDASSVWVLTLLGALAAFPALSFAQTNPPPQTAATSTWSSPTVVLFKGLSGVKDLRTGSLSIEGPFLIFHGVLDEKGIDKQKEEKHDHKDEHSDGAPMPPPQLDGSIPIGSIRKVFLGDEQQELGGKGMRIGKAVMPWGSGQVVSMFAHHKVGILTVEYSDTNGGYHGTIFVLPLDHGAAARRYLSRGQARTQQSVTGIQDAPLTPTSDLQHPKNQVAAADPGFDGPIIEVDPVQSTLPDFPNEYRVALYEDLVTQLTKKFGSVYRTGDVTIPHARTIIHVALNVTSFDEGSEVVRASAGLVGIFVGATKIGTDVRVVRGDRTVLGEFPLKSAQRSAKESMDATDGVAKTVAKVLSKKIPS